MHIQCLICYCFYPTGWNSKGKNSELSVSHFHPPHSPLFSATRPPQACPISIQQVIPMPTAHWQIQILWAQLFSLACMFVSLFSQLDKLSRYICPGELGTFGCGGPASVGDSFFLVVTGSGLTWRQRILHFPPSSPSTLMSYLSLSLVFQVAGILHVDVQREECALAAQSYLTLCDPWTVTCQAPLSVGCPRQEYWSGLPFSSLEDIPDPRMEPRSPALQADSLLSELPRKPHRC